MKKHLSLFVLCMLVMPAFAAGRSMIDVESRAVIKPTVHAMPSIRTDVNLAKKTPGTGESGVSVVDDDVQPAAVGREKERLACVSNNIGVGNTFVWASKSSNTGNYATMTEDVEHPENNVCFVRVELKSNDQKINIADMQGQYFAMGTNITCGSWIDEEKLEQRILDAKKAGRVWATIGAAVGSAGVGVGAMELIGNKVVKADEPVEHIISDSIAGVVLGTTGALITSHIVKKNQLKNGFEDIVCTVGGQTVGNYGDEITVGVK